jgi:5-methylcytosine-specific restriction protein B
MRKMREDFTDAWVSSNSSPSADNQFFVTFHPSFTYEDFVEGIRPESDDAGGPVRYPLCAGIFKQACERAVQLAGFDRGLAAFCSLPTAERKRLLAVARPAVLYIDEINRGNVARILGELISLIEPDKRLGADQELVVTLPGSRQYFGVPSNLWLIGTMNTADRSVVALDVALRRRFAFQECPPQPELLDGVLVDGVDLGRLLRTINRRLLFLRDRDHLIGHAFFLPLKTSPSLDALRRVFREAVIPLLLEYFHDDLGRVGLVLGPQWVRRIAGGNIFALGFDHDQRDDLSERPVWEVVDAKDQPIEAFRSIDG